VGAMAAQWMKRDELAVALDMTGEELLWYEEQFREQIRLLTRPGEDGGVVYSSDALRLLQGVSAMCAHGATPEQIKGWFGLA